jgi:AraC-like DNA-binding protein
MKKVVGHPRPRRSTGEKRRSHRSERTLVPALNIRVMIDYFGTTPELRRRLLAGSGVTEIMYSNSDTEFRLGHAIAVQENLVEIIGEDWPLQVASVVDARMLGALEVAIRSARTFGASIEIFAQYVRARTPRVQMRANRSESFIALELSPHTAFSAKSWRAGCLMMENLGAALLQSVLGQQINSLEFHFSWDEPLYAPLARSIFPGLVRFGAPGNAIVAPIALRDVRSPYADASLLALAITDLEQTLRLVGEIDVMMLRVTRHLDRYSEGRATELEIANLLGVSRRTLARRLMENGTSFRKLLDESLKRRAEVLRNSGRYSRGEMAQMLGFEDPSSFSRACRRWFAMTAS